MSPRSALPCILFTPASPSNHPVNLDVTETALVCFSVSSFEAFPTTLFNMAHLSLPTLLYFHSELWHPQHYVCEWASASYLMHVFMQLMVIERHHVSGTALGPGDKWTRRSP